ncbi:alpha/beta hydrolase [Sinorhizobium meliloti]|uniref:alpha/beta hydrolase n=1 Tax=Rhizobium meliloti TaxID=382 RepID=UPI000FD4690D|nr:alpha/beta hydrolase [Sinorhizobium meliloti]RVG81162.1 alpha/beta hydrolase [Sinorhizobium meliloti]RVI11940.1 alpha/beta hydrolase [Sinorhizobium meliloti]RVN43064.1 alpha/beta hydrolase [Sinorhizobium meliloti]RVN82421.1 alpha/beta hydrolase [Sinorhizobium meliloti]RVO03192.1 alpha/beta hydrolase [Sinorhizobium meliloti]
MVDHGYVHKLKAGRPGGPILFVLHGTGGDENQFFGFGAQLLPEATVVSPRGDVSEHGAARFFRRTGEGVYDMADLARATEKMAGFVKALAGEHDASEIIGLGYSNGANILANVLIEEGVFDKAVLMHPLIPFRPKDNPALAGRKILITAGERDPICPAPMTQALGDYFTKQKATVEFEWHSGGHDIRQNEIGAIEAFLKA